ncbi:telomerase reverse transcriptase, partial [Phenoliferia sp. Uapishka_3]
MEANAPPRPPTNTVLSLFYPHLTPLSAIFSKSILRDDDSPAFKYFLDTVLVGSPEEIAAVVACEDPEAQMKDVIDRAHSKLFALHRQANAKTVLPPGQWLSKTPSNVLCFGYRPVREALLGPILFILSPDFSIDLKADGRSDVFSAGGFGITNYVANTVVTHIRQSTEWRTLVTRVGIAPLITIFSSPTTAVFSPLPNFCYLQLSGQPMSDLTPIKSNSRMRAFRASIATANPKQAPLSTDKKSKTHRSSKRRRGNPKNQSAAPLDTNTILNETLTTKIRLASDAFPVPPAKRSKLSSSKSAPQLDPPSVQYSTSSRPNLLQPQRLRGLGPSVSVSALEESSKRKAFGREDEVGPTTAKRRKLQAVNTPNEVVFFRTRLYHARPSKNSRGQVIHGVSPNHIFTRLPTLFPEDSQTEQPRPLPSDRQTRHLLKYVFPHQFGLKSPFSFVKQKWGAIPDYGNREAEIELLASIKTPNRLKEASGLVERMIRLQEKCRYRKLLDKCCPRKVSRNGDPIGVEREQAKSALNTPTSPEPRTQLSRTDISIEVSQRSLIFPHGAEAAKAKARAKPKFSEYACTPHEVDTFLRAVIRQVVPRDFWGSEANAAVILDHVTTFVRLRRYETYSVHALLQNFCLSDCDWIRPSSGSKVSNKFQVPNAVEMNKRRELLCEFVFWFVDGFIFDLLKTTFMMTESASSRNRTLFFRQDDWEAVCKPLLATLQQSMFNELPKQNAERILANRTLGFSYLRLLPKDTGVRPIVNLQRKPKKLGRQSQVEYGKSINQQLQTTFQALAYEKRAQPQLLGASAVGPSEIYPRLKKFKASLQLDGKALPKLYFVKVDVKACFDTIKQDKLLHIIETVLKEDAYVVQKFSKVTTAAGRVSKAWPRQAYPENENLTFPDVATELSAAVRNAVYADNVIYTKDSKSVMMSLLREHVKRNLIKIGGRYFRQRDGIPQGSVLSSFLCSIFYGHMEKTFLRFTRDQSSLLLRYIDDFLFVTTKRPLASRFLRIMNNGLPEYGCFIAAEKRLTNFDITLDSGEIVPTHNAAKDFPYCGLTINTETLDVKAEISRYDDVGESLLSFIDGL